MIIFARSAMFAATLQLLLAGAANAQVQPPPQLEDPGEQIITPEQEGTSEGDDLEQLSERDETSLDSLFADLKRTPDANAAKRISGRIWAAWAESGSPTVNLLMNRAAKAMQDKQNGVATDILDHVIRLKPDYAEGWNRRATLYFQMNDYSRSLADIEQTLALEPRHFGALSGLAVILQQVGKDEKALEVWKRVLEVYPANQDAQKRVIDLSDELYGRKS